MSSSIDLIEGIIVHRANAEFFDGVRISGWNGTPVVQVTDSIVSPKSESSTSSAFSVALYPNGDMQWSYASHVSGAQNYGIYTVRRTAGVWGTEDYSGYVTSQQVPDTEMVLDLDGNFWIYSDAVGTGVHGEPNVKIHYKKNGVWQLFEPFDEVAIHGQISLLTQSHLIGSQPEEGHFVGFLDSTNSVVYLITSADLLFGDPITTFVPTTPAPSTLPPTTAVPTTAAATTPGPTTLAPSTATPVTTDPALTPVICCGRSYATSRQEVIVRAWVESFAGRQLFETPLSRELSSVTLFSESGEVGSVSASADPIGEHVLQFRIPQIQLRPGHAYVLRVHIFDENEADIGTADFAMGTT